MTRPGSSASTSQSSGSRDLHKAVRLPPDRSTGLTPGTRSPADPVDESHQIWHTQGQTVVFGTCSVRTDGLGENVTVSLHQGQTQVVRTRLSRYRKPVTEPPYRPLDAQVIPRFAGIRTFMRAPHVTDLRGVDAAVYGIPFDTATTYRTGARFGPEAIRSASALIRPYHPVHDVNVVEALSIVDYGDLPVSPGDTERTYGQVEDTLAPIVDAGVFPAAMGGDHSITLPELRVLARKHGPLALVQLDAHADTWDEYFGQRYFHGTTFKRAAEERLLEPAASVQAGMRGSVYAAGDLQGARGLGFTVLTSDELRALTSEQYAELVHDKVGERPVFLSFDVDFLDPAFAPGTGTPEIAGFSTAEAVGFLRALRGINLVGCDVVEVSPSYDGPGQQTALAAANVLWELLALRATR